MPSCHSCSQSFPDFASLAKHILVSKKGHNKGKKWAAHFVMNTNQLNRKAQFQNINKNRTPLSEEQEEIRDSLKIELSGENEVVTTHCLKCKTYSKTALPIEYTQSNYTWRDNKGILILTCTNCHTL